AGLNGEVMAGLLGLDSARIAQRRAATDQTITAIADDGAVVDRTLLAAARDGEATPSARLAAMNTLLGQTSAVTSRLMAELDGWARETSGSTRLTDAVAGVRAVRTVAES